MDRPVTREDLDELKDDIKILERKVDEMTAAMNRIELEFARSSAKAVLETAEEMATLKLELQKYKSASRAELGNISMKTAILWGILGSGVLIVFGALVATAVQKLFGTSPK